MNLKSDWAKWERTRKRGFIRFVLVWGVLGWGLSTGILFSLVFSQLMPATPQARIWVWSLSIPAFAVTGLFFGATFWLVMEWLRRRSAQQPT